VERWRAGIVTLGNVLEATLGTGIVVDAEGAASFDLVVRKSRTPAVIEGMGS